MTAMLAIVQILSYVAIAGAAVSPVWRRPVSLWLLTAAAASLCAAALAWGTERTLQISHAYPAYVGLEVRQKSFPIEELSGVPGPYWGLVCALFCLPWAVWAWRGQGGTPSRSFGPPLILGLSGVALQLLLEKAAAPGSLVAPFDLGPDRVMLPATVAGALLLARPGLKIIHLILYLSVFVAVGRLPVAVFGTLATQNHWGTHLDVHGTTFFAPPGSASIAGGLEVTPGDPAQLFWLVWAPHLLIFPGLYLMSTGGLAFLKLMWLRQIEEDARGPR